LVSNDCGATWSSLRTINGTTLANNGNINTERFIPGPNSTWDTEIIDLSDFAGNTNVSLAFRAISDYGNSLYLDNIIVSESTVGLTEIENVDIFKLTPNPATEYLNIDFKLADNESYTLTLLDFSGKAVSTIVTGAQSQTTQTLDISNLAVGMYFVQAATAEGIKIQKFIKQ